MVVVALIRALDTKGAECTWLTEQLDKHGMQVPFVDAGSFSAGPLTNVSPDDVIAIADSDVVVLHERRDQGEVMQVMSVGATRIIRDLVVSGRIYGLLVLGGSGDSPVAAAVVQTLPVGFPKLLVSTMASGDVKPYVGEVDAILMYSIVSVADINSVSSQVFASTVAAIAGMAQAYKDRLAAVPAGHKPVTAITMFGATAPAADEVRDTLTDLDYEVLTLHAIGAGGRIMEKLAESGLLIGMCDLTTTELADDLVDDVLSTGPRRLEMVGQVGLSQAVSLEALDIVNFDPADTVPLEFAGRNLFVHNPTVTLMCTTPEEMVELGRRIAVRLAAATGPTELFIPLRGVSAIDVEGAPFRDTEANAALFVGLCAGLVGSGVVVHELGQAIDDPGSGAAMARALHASITS